MGGVEAALGHAVSLCSLSRRPRLTSWARSAERSRRRPSRWCGSSCTTAGWCPSSAPSPTPRSGGHSECCGLCPGPRRFPTGSGGEGLGLGLTKLGDPDGRGLPQNTEHRDGRMRETSQVRFSFRETSLFLKMHLSSRKPQVRVQEGGRGSRCRRDGPSSVLAHTGALGLSAGTCSVELGSAPPGPWVLTHPDTPC